MSAPAVTADLAAEHGLTPEEYAKILDLLGRAPTFEELGVFAVMWSEHCSYKSSRAWLRQLPTGGAHVRPMSIHAPRVALLESRMSRELARLVEKHGGEPL